MGMVEFSFIASLLTIAGFCIWGIHANKRLYEDNPVIREIEVKKREIEKLERHMDNFEKLESLEEYARILKSR